MSAGSPRSDPGEDRDLWDEGYRAAKSMALSTAEGGRREGKDRGYHFRIAAGSAQELKMALDLAIAFRFVTRAADGPSLTLIDRVLAMLWRLQHPKRRGCAPAAGHATRASAITRPAVHSLDRLPAEP